jgi:hypothetical protein
MASQADVDTLRTLAASGVTMVQFADGRRVQYASPKEMLDAASRLEALIPTATFERTTRIGTERDDGMSTTWPVYPYARY